MTRHDVTARQYRDTYEAGAEAAERGDRYSLIGTALLGLVAAFLLTVLILAVGGR